MALSATIYRVQVNVSDVDRGVYEELDLRLARHPSETMRYLLTRTLAYCLSYEEGIAWSKGGVSSTEEPPIAVRDPTGALRVWIDIGAPSADRLHRATKAADRVLLFTHTEPLLLRREAASRTIHRAREIEVWRIEPALLDALEATVDRNARVDLTRSDGRLYVTVNTRTMDGAIERVPLIDPTEPM
jgi:uncharacterized protein YaeQ